MTAVRLVSLTPDAETQILYCARVSSNQENTDPGLIRYLIRNKHWSPFEMASATFEIITSRAIAQQILRHRSFSFQEFSQRYATVEEYEVYEARLAGATNRQSSLETDDNELQEWWNDVQHSVAAYSFQMYHDALGRGIAPEVARFVLPLSTRTTLYMTGTLRSWIHYFEIRCDEHAQKEHRVIANIARALLLENLPNIKEALYGAQGVYNDYRS